MFSKFLKVFLRLAVAAGFLSAVADRFGLWSPDVSAWGNWDSFVAYTAAINPWLPESIVNFTAYLSTIAEGVLAIMLLIGFKTKWAGIISGILLLSFALAMSLSSPLGVKRAFDASVFAASGAAFAISVINSYFWEIDGVIKAKKSHNRYKNLSWTKSDV